MRTNVVLFVVLLSACRTAPEPASPSVSRSEAAAALATSAPPADAGGEDAGAEGAKTAVLSLDESVMLDEIEVTWTGRRHKHGKGFSTGIWTVKLEKRGDVEEVELRSNGALWAEGLAFGYVWELRGDYEALVVTLMPATDILTEDEAHEQLRAALSDGDVDCASTASSTSQGVLSMVCRDGNVDVARGEIGLYSRRVRIAAPD